MTIDINLAKSITIAYEALQECLRIDDARGIRVWARVLRSRQAEAGYHFMIPEHKLMTLIAISG